MHAAEGPVVGLGALSALALPPQFVKAAFEGLANEDMIAARCGVPLERTALGADLVHNLRKHQAREPAPALRRHLDRIQMGGARNSCASKMTFSARALMMMDLLSP